MHMKIRESETDENEEGLEHWTSRLSQFVPDLRNVQHKKQHEEENRQQNRHVPDSNTEQKCACRFV